MGSSFADVGVAVLAVLNAMRLIRVKNYNCKIKGTILRICKTDNYQNYSCKVKRL